MWSVYNSSVFLLSLSTCLNKESFPGAAVLHILPQCGSFLLGTLCLGQTALLKDLPLDLFFHEVFKNGSFSLITVFKNFSNVGSPHGLQSFSSILHQHGSFTGCRSSRKFLLHGLLSLGCSSCQEPVPVWGLQSMYLPSAYIHLLWHRVLYGPNCGCIFRWGPQSAARSRLCIHSLHHDCRGISAPAPVASPPCPSLDVCRAISMIFSYSYPTVPVQNFALS